MDYMGNLRVEFLWVMFEAVKWGGGGGGGGGGKLKNKRKLNHIFIVTLEVTQSMKSYLICEIS